MSGYELNEQDIQTVLKHLRDQNPNATEEDAREVLLKEKMKIRYENLDQERKAIYPEEQDQQQES